MSRLANAQVSRMSNKRQETGLNKDQLSNGARSGRAGSDVFRQEPQKAILRRAVGHHTAKSTTLKRGWGGMAPLLPIVWMELFFKSKSLVFLSFPAMGWSRELLTEI